MTARNKGMDASRSSLLLVGIDNSGLARSARDAGHRVFTVDYFGDLDVRGVSDGFMSVIEQRPGVSSGRFEENYSPEALYRVFESLHEGAHGCEGTLLSTGLDDSFNILEKIDERCRIIGNSPETVKAIRCKRVFFQELEKMGVPHPETSVTASLESAVEEARRIGYPLILKPSEGFAGVGVRRVDDEQQLVKEYRGLSGSCKEIVVQEYIEGTPASVSFMASNHKSRIVALNEQLLGLKNTYQPEPFGYCGNVTPYLTNKATVDRCSKIVEKISRRFNLMGSNGVDLVVSGDGTPYVIEVNPRFQGSLMCVERAYGVNLIKSHLAACRAGELDERRLRPRFFSTRLIIYAPWRVVAPDLTSNPHIMDVPCPGSIIEKGEPICSIMSDGATREESLRGAQETARSILSLVSS
jgi:predicted ATP-grasp superfamily ATP-dependent carboligase